MQMKNNRFIRITTIAFALTVLTGYVVYSQRQQTHSVTRLSFPAATNKTDAQTRLKGTTNLTTAQKSALVASGSKSRAPLFEIRPDQAGIVAPSSKSIAPILKIHAAEGSMIAPGSKSAPVFDLRDRTQALQAKAPAIVPKSPTTNPATAKFQTPARSAQLINEAPR
jgi:hypothetical protein